MNTSYSVAIIGLGQIGMGYDFEIDSPKIQLSHAKAFTLNQHFNIVAGVDTNKDNCDRFENKYKRPAYNSVTDFLNIAKVDVFVISTNTESHLKIISEINYFQKPKVILLEKPIAYTFEESKQILKICKSNNVALFVNYIRISDEVIYSVNEKFKKGDFGHSISGLVRYHKGLIHNGSHFFNLLELWLGKMSKYKVINEGRKINEFDAEPTFFVSFGKSNIYFLPSAKNENSIELISENGSLKYDGFNNLKWHPTKDINSSIKFVTLMDQYQANVVSQLFNYLSLKNYKLCSAEMALQTLKSIHKILNNGKQY